MKKDNVVIGYPYGGSITPTFSGSMEDLLLADRNIQSIERIERVGGLYVDSNRNIIISGFLKRCKAEWLFFFDTDIGFGPAAYYNMLKQADPDKTPVLSALYFLPLDGILTFSWFEGTEVPYTVVSKVEPGLNDITACGMGCCLVHRWVLEKMADHFKDPYVWFAYENVAPTKELHHPEEQPFAYGHVLREDLSFCRRAREVGVPIKGDGTTVVGHMKSQLITLTTFNEQQLIMKILNKTDPKTDGSKLEKVK